MSLIGLLFVFTAYTQAAPLTDPDVSAKLGISVQQLHSLRAAFDLTNEDILQMSEIQLDTMLEELSHPGIDKHAEEQKFRALKMMDEHGRIPPDGLLRALEHRRHMEEGDADLFPVEPDPSPIVPDPGTPGPLTAGIQTNGWTWLGPGNIGGRVRAILMHPTSTNIMWCGGVDGGVWKTTNSGVAWFPLNDFMPNLAIACLVMDPTNANVIYAGTGEGMYNGDAIRGAGIFKTSDGGTSWTQLASTANSSFLYVSRLAIDPNNNQVLLAATRSGIYRSTDAGGSWSQSLGTETMDLKFHPTDSSQAIASGPSGQAWYSTDGGQSWTAATGIPSGSGRVEITYSRSSPSLVFASVDRSSGQLYRSTDGGQTYSLRSTGYSYLSAQGWYDNALWADPTTTNIVIVGGLDLWRSTDGGLTFFRISQWQSAPTSAHADHHVIVQSAAFNGTTVKTVFFGNDGGVYRANDVYNVSLTSGWQELNNNLGITQFYGGAGNPSSGVIVGGTQDNGDLRYTPAGGTEGWTAWDGGDGGFSAADGTDPNYFYGEYVYLQIHRTSNGGSSAADIYSGISDAGNGSAANFIAPFILDQNNPNTMLAGGLSLWRSTNVKAATPSWSAIKASNGSKISAIAVAPANSDVIWVGHNNGDVFYTTNGTAVAPTWFQRDLGTPNLPNRYCERIAIAPGSSRVYVAFGGFNSDNVWRTSDSGVTWTNITSNLPAAPVNSIVIAPADTNTLYVGTEVGVFGSSDAGAHWSTGNDGPANVAVDQLFWLGGKLVAVTHGRGMFSTTPTVGGPNLVDDGNVLSGGNGNGSIDPNECNQLNLLVQNVGGSNATSVSATLSTTTPGVSIIQSASSYPNLAVGALGTNSTAFQISTSPSFVCGTPVMVTLNLTFTGGSSIINYNLPSGSDNSAFVQSSGASIVAGATDIGNHGDDVTTTISLPFAYTFYGQSFTNAALSSNGTLQFSGGNNDYANACLPASAFANTIFAHWDDLRTDGVGGGIFTSISGSAPNRIFNIEWRATYYSGGASLNFEVRLYEGQQRFEIIYGALNGNGSSATVGVQKDTGNSFAQFECNAGGLSNGLQLSFQQSCADGGGACSATLAGFAADPTNGLAPLTVSFTNLSTGATNYYWDFGDSSTSTSGNPVHAYLNAGSYNVTLTAVGAGGSNTLTRPNFIVATNLLPVLADFAGAPTNGLAPLPVSFTNLSTGATNYNWDFGDGNSSSAANPANTYSNAGSYTVTLIVIGAGGTNTLARTNYVVVTNLPPVTADFAAVPNSGGAPLTVTFSNLSSGATAYDWDFGDGGTSANINPVNTYISAGSYSVRLTASGPGGTNGLTKTNYVVVTNAAPSIVSQPQNQTVTQGAVASFSVTANGTPPLSFQWRFNDTPISGATATIYTRTNAQFTNAGGYSVVVSNLAGIAISSNALLTVTTMAGVIPVIGDPYSQNFDGMGPAGTVSPLGWYVGTGTGAISGTNVTAGTGSSQTGGNYNFGSSGDSDRALGSLASNSTQRDTEARFINVSGSLINSFTIAYTGEQWRVGGNGSVNNDLVMQYSTNGTTFVPMGAQFNFNTPLDSGPAGPLDGNAPSNRVTGIGGTYTPSASIADGQVFYLRWADADNSSSDHAMAVDDFVITFALTNPVSPAQLVVSPANLDFGSVVTNTTSQADLVVSNAGGIALTGTASISAGAFAILDAGGAVSNLQFVVPPLGATNLAIAFSPPAPGVFSNILVLASSGGDSTNALAGQGVIAPLILEPTVSAGVLSFSFMTIAGKLYVIEYKDSLDDPNWLPLQSIPGDGTLKTINTSTDAAPQRFYRLNLQ